MSILFIFFSACVIGFLIKCIYQNLDTSEPPPPDTKQETKPPPTLQDTLISLLNYFKGHINQIEVSQDSVVIYCFKKSVKDNISDFNIIKIRFCDLNFKSISSDDVKELQEKLDQAMGLVITNNCIEETSQTE